MFVGSWDSATGAGFHTLEGHSDNIGEVVFSPDGRLVAATSDDGTIRIWDSVTGIELQTLTGHTNHVWAVAFSPMASWWPPHPKMGISELGI
jgi:WD40 repeat protein